MSPMHHGMTAGRDELAEYLRENRARFYRIAYSYVRQPEDALDIVQNAIVRELARYGSLREKRYLGSWFYRILINESLGQLRRRRRCRETVDIDGIELPDRHAPPPDDDFGALVRSLAPETQTIVYLRYYENLKFPEIARLTGWNVNTVKTRLYQALKQLRTQWKQENQR